MAPACLWRDELQGLRVELPDRIENVDCGRCWSKLVDIGQHQTDASLAPTMRNVGVRFELHTRQLALVQALGKEVTLEPACGHDFIGVH